MTDDMGRRGIKTTGNHQIDQATAEIAGHIRDGRIGSHTRYREQDHYDEAMRLRDEILAGAAELPSTHTHAAERRLAEVNEEFGKLRALEDRAAVIRDLARGRKA